MGIKPGSRSNSKSKTKVIPAKKSIIRRIRNYVLFSIIMMFIGGSADRYKNDIFAFITHGYRPAIEKITDLVKLSSAKKPSTDVAVTFDNANGENKNLDTTFEVIRHKYYSLGYNENREQPNWVTYRLTKSMILNKSVGRSNNFREDPMVTSGSATLADYRKSNYDRGHLCPAAAMRFSKTAMSETFYMSNMSPQVPEFNRGIWKKLEEKVRKWTVNNGELDVVTGPVFYKSKKHKEIGADGVDVPDAYFKVILDYKKPHVKAIGFLLPNTGSNGALSNYAYPVDNIERITGFDFFATLPDNVENKIEKEVNYYSWK
jgi:endonuclease G, mitochondrial